MYIVGEIGLFYNLSNKMLALKGQACYRRGSANEKVAVNV
jgi:hypothetical protein